MWEYLGWPCEEQEEEQEEDEQEEDEQEEDEERVYLDHPTFGGSYVEYPDYPDDPSLYGL